MRPWRPRRRPRPETAGRSSADRDRPVPEVGGPAGPKAALLRPMLQRPNFCCHFCCARGFMVGDAGDARGADSGCLAVGTPARWRRPPHPRARIATKLPAAQKELKDELAIMLRESERLYERLQYRQVRLNRLSPS